MKVYYDKDCDLSLIKGKTVAIIGGGFAQGRRFLGQSWQSRLDRDGSQ